MLYMLLFPLHTHYVGFNVLRYETFRSVLAGLAARVTVRGTASEEFTLLYALKLLFDDGNITKIEMEADGAGKRDVTRRPVYTWMA